MTTSLEDRAAQPGAVIYCRIPANVATAASAVAAHEMISLADVARRALVADLRQRGLPAESGWRRTP